MGTIVLVGVLAAIVYYVLNQTPVPQPAGSIPETDKVGIIRDKLTTGWPRQAILFVACLVIAWSLIGWGLATWLGIAVWLGSPLGLNPWLVTLIVLAIGGAVIYKTNSAPKIKAFGQGQWQKIADLPDAPPTIARSSVVPEKLIPADPMIAQVTAEPAPFAADAPTNAHSKNGILRTAALLIGSAVIGWYLISAVLTRFAAGPQPEMELPPAEPASSGAWWVVAVLALAAGVIWYWKRRRGAVLQAGGAGISGDESVPATETPARKPASLWLVGAGIVGTPSAVVLAAALYNPEAFSTVRTWASAVLSPSSANDPATNNTTAASTNAAEDDAEDVALDTVARDFVDKASIARGAREAIANDLSVALANAERNQQADDINRFRKEIAEKEQAIAAARQSARESLTMLAQAQGEAPDLVTQALSLVAQHSAVTSDPKGAALVTALQRMSGPEDVYLASGMSAWEEAAAATVEAPPSETAGANPEPGISVAPAQPASAPVSATGRRSGVPVTTPPERMRRDPFGRAEQGYSRQSGSARDRQRRSSPDAQIPNDEFQ